MSAIHRVEELKVSVDCIRVEARGLVEIVDESTLRYTTFWNESDEANPASPVAFAFSMSTYLTNPKVGSTAEKKEKSSKNDGPL